MLTDRQLEVLAALIDGSTRDAAAEALGISRKTVDAHLHAISEATGAAGIVATYWTLGWLQLPPSLSSRPGAFRARSAPESDPSAAATCDQSTPTTP